MGLAQLGLKLWVLVPKRLGLSVVVSALCLRQLMELRHRLKKLELLVIEWVLCRLLLIERYLVVREQMGRGQLGWESRVLVSRTFGLLVVASPQCLLLPMELGSHLRRLGQVALDSMPFELSEFELWSLHHQTLGLLVLGWVSFLLVLMELLSCLKKLELLVEW